MTNRPAPHRFRAWKLSSGFVPITGGSIVAFPGAKFLSAAFVNGRILVTYLDPLPAFNDGRTQYGPMSENVEEMLRYEIIVAGGGDEFPHPYPPHFVGSFRQSDQTFCVFVR